MSVWRHMAAVAAKDLRVETRNREILFTMAFFAALIVVVLAFAFDRQPKFSRAAAPGLIWAAIAFAGVIGLGRAFDREREGDTMRALLLSPASRLGIFLGKAATVSLLIFGVGVVCVPLCGLLLSVNLFEHPLELVLSLALGAIGIAVVGTLFAASLLRSNARDVLLPIVLYPLLIPLFVGGTRVLTALLHEPADLPEAHYWLAFLALFDGAFLVVCLWLFESVVIE